jgi:hypothetical protein
LESFASKYGIKKPQWFHHIERLISDLFFSIIVALTKSYISNKNMVLGAN